MPNFYEASFDFLDFKKTSFGHLFRKAGHQKPSSSNSGRRPGVDSVFLETIIIIVSLGPSILKDVIFDEDLLISSFHVFLCHVLYNIFSIFYNATVNAEPLSPPILGSGAIDNKDIYGEGKTLYHKALYHLRMNVCHAR